MLTISERAVTMLIWTLTAMGVYFALRAAWRQRKGTLRDQTLPPVRVNDNPRRDRED